MAAEAVLADLAQDAGALALAWFMAGLAGWLIIGFAAVLLAQRRPPRQPAGHGLLRQLLPGLGLGFALIAAAACIFAMLANGMATDAGIGRFDRLLSAAMHEHASAGAYRFFAAVTHFGDTALLTVLCVGGATVLVLLRRPLLAMGLVAAIGGNSLLNPTLKAIFERARPAHDGLAFDGWSFPSGHASGAVVAYGMLAYILLRTLPARWHLPVILLAAAIAFSTGFSRLYLQAHYLSDVVAGFASGAAWLTVCIGCIEFVRVRQRTRLMRVSA